MTQDEFSKIVTLFGVLGSILIIFNSINISSIVSNGINIVIWLLGLISLLALLLDLESNASCKVALRNRSKIIEDLLTNDCTKTLMIWRCVIPNRNKFCEESIFKSSKKTDGENKDPKVENEVDLFIWGSRIIILMWFFSVLFVIIYGDKIQWVNLS